MQKVITNFTVLDEDNEKYQMGWRNYITTRGDESVEFRFRNSEVLTMKIDDFKKLMLAGERLIELMAKQEKSDEKAK